MNVVIGVPTYGNIKFTRLTIEHIIRTAGSLDYDLAIVIGKEDDRETLEYCNRNGIQAILHTYNKGLPASINDLYDYTFKLKKRDALIVVGNDVLPYWNSLERLVEVASTTEYGWVSGDCILAETLMEEVPACKSYFGGGERGVNFLANDLYEWLDDYKPDSNSAIVDTTHYKIIGDTHNMCLFTKDIFESVGYIDVNFFPAYFEDNDYARRAILLGNKICNVKNAKYFHFWSRTVHQGNMKGTNDKFFPLNKEYYFDKWGGEPGDELYDTPFNDTIPLKISDRVNEKNIIKEWSEKRK